jgi:hypothetical protein
MPVAQKPHTTQSRNPKSGAHPSPDRPCFVHLSVSHPALSARQAPALFVHGKHEDQLRLSNPPPICPSHVSPPQTCVETYSCGIFGSGDNELSKEYFANLAWFYAFLPCNKKFYTGLSVVLCWDIWSLLTRSLLMVIR